VTRQSSAAAAKANASFYNRHMYVALAFFGIVFSLFYGAYATTIWLRFPEFPDPGKAIDRKQAWLEGWFDIWQHPRYVHEFWFNFGGSALGWTALGYAIWRIHSQPERFGIAEAALFLASAIGITGYLPNTLRRIGVGFEALGTAIKHLSAPR
jgi:hypothetical protein